MKAAEEYDQINAISRCRGNVERGLISLLFFLGCRGCNGFITLESSGLFNVPNAQALLMVTLSWNFEPLFHVRQLTGKVLIMLLHAMTICIQ